ncbi:hypothetical protein ACFV9D_33510 [Streptomyces sp. NPDC059875]|uniref:hypothetical protein n=1 Tax=unclassified Streptomyces TaxID=2593676 RepID=UPI00365C8BC6
MVNDEVDTVGTAVLLAAAPAGRGRAVDAASVLPALAAVPPSALTGTPVATVVELADPLDPQAVLTRLRAAAATPGPLAVYLAGQLQLDRRQHLPHLALARSTPTTLRYTGLPWHWLAAELATRRPGTTTVVADLVADPELWQRLRTAPGLVSLGPGPLLYGRIAPAPRRGDPATPEYLRHFATVWRTGARPPLSHLHAEAATQAGDAEALLLTPEWGAGAPTTLPMPGPAAGSPVAMHGVPAGAGAGPGTPAAVSGGTDGAGAYGPGRMPEISRGPDAQPVPAGPGVAVVGRSDGPDAVAQVRQPQDMGAPARPDHGHPPVAADGFGAGRPAVPAPAASRPLDDPARGTALAHAPGAGTHHPPTLPAPKPLAAVTPEPTPAPADPGRGSATAPARTPTGPGTGTALASVPAAPGPPAPGLSGPGTGTTTGAVPSVTVPAPVAFGTGASPVAAPAPAPSNGHPLAPAGGRARVTGGAVNGTGHPPVQTVVVPDPHPAILAAARAGRHGEAVAVAVAWEQEALRRYGPRSQQALHWMEVRADLARLAGEPGRSCELWIAAAQARLGLSQGPDDPDVEGAVDRAHHQWEQIEDPARARELGPALVALRQRVPGRKAGALAALQRRMR